LRRGDDLVFVGDVHLDRDDPDLPAFLEALERIGASAARVVLMGDLFNLWIGDPALEQPHHRAVIDVLRALRRDGVQLHYLEGNRDYRIARAHLGATFDAVSDLGLDESWGGRRIWASHGDLVNAGDAQYRIWRRVSRSDVAQALFGLLPRSRRFRLAEGLERRMRGTNLEMKRELPSSTLNAFASPLMRDGADAVVLGHFHQELDLAVAPGKRILVLPLWKERRRCLRVTADGTMRFEES